MAAPVRFLSGRQQQQKIGIEGSTQNEKVLEVVGRVGIGTTVFDTTKALDVRGDVEISGIISATRFLGDGSQLANLPASGVGATDNVNTSGIITASTFSGSKGDFTNLSVSGLSTFSSTVDINANLDVTGHAELDNVNVAGVSTFAGAIDANGGLDVSGGSGLVANTAKISDLTDNRVVIAGASGELEDSSKLTFDGTKLAVDGNLGVTGLTTTQNLNVAGVSTFVGLVTVTTGDVHIAQRLFVGGLEVEGTGSENTFTGINTFTNQQDNTLGNTNTGSLQGNGGLGIDKNASFGDKVFVQNAIGINSTAPIGKLDVNGHTELDDVNVSAALTAASLNVTNKLTTTGLGISVANGTGNTAYIEGPSEIWIDPAPAGAGTTSGLVRIRGDLYVDGTEFIVDVDKVQLSDYRIGIATTAGTNAVLDGAGLGIGSESIEKTITWNNATSALMSSENWNLASGKHYEIAGTDVLTSTTLGGGVVNSSLTSVGTLGSLTVSGDITANGNIVGDNATNISNINQVTATTFSGALSGNATSATTATNVTVADESSDTTCNVLFTTAATGNLAPKSGTNLTFNSSNGTLTATEFSGGGAGLTGISASQVGAIADIVSDTTPQLGGNLDVNNKDITGTGNVNLTGIVTATNFVGGGAGLTGITAGQVGAITDLVSDTTPQLGGNLDLNSKLINGTGGINVTGIVTASSFDGNITGIATYTSEWIITSNGSSDYKFTGPGFDGTELDPTIYLVRGQEYKFTNNMGAHPFQIRTAINGSAYNDGISNNGVSNGTLTWDVQMDAPNVLYYQCTSHAGMVGKIYIGNSGDSVNVGTGVTINAGGINVTGVVTATSFVGNGAGLTGLTANQVGAIGDVVSDTTPQLGGNLDLNSKTINGTGTINFTGNVTATAFAGSGANLTSLPVPTEVIVTDESSDTSCNVLFTTAATGNLAPKSGTNLTFNSSSGTLTATAFSGDGSALTNLPAGSTPDKIEEGNTSAEVVDTGSDGHFKVTTEGTERLRVVSSGRVGINSIAPTSTLDVNGTVNVTGVSTFQGNVNLGQSDKLLFNGTSGLEIYENGTIGVIQANNNSGRLTIEVNNGGGGNSAEIIQLRGTGNLISANFKPDSGVQLYGRTGSNSAEVKLETNSTGIDVTGHIEADTINVSGISTFGSTTVSSLIASNTTLLGGFTASGNSSIVGDLTLQDTDAGSAAGPELKLYRNSGTPADADYLGQIKFAGESDTGVERNYAKITGKISDASNTSEDGILEFAHIKAGSQTITGRWNSTELQLLNGTHFSLGDSQEIRVGASDDLLIYHDGSNSYIKDSGTGNLLIQAESLVAIQDTSGNNSAIFNDGGTVELYHNNSKKFETTSGGATVTGTLTATTFSGSGASLTAVDAATLDGVDSTSFLRSDAADTKTSGNLTFNDNIVAQFGTGSDLKIYHDSAQSLISQEGAGDLTIRNLNDDNDVIIQSDDGSGGAANYFRAQGGTGEAKLYHYGNEKLATNSGGVTITGTLTATTFSGSGASLNNVDAATLDGVDSTSFLRSDAADAKTSGDLTFNDNIKARFGGAGDLEIYHDGSNSYISDGGTGNLLIRAESLVAIQDTSGNNSAIFNDGGTVELYHNNSLKFTTQSYGIDVTGEVQCDSLDVDGAADISDDVTFQSATSGLGVFYDKSADTLKLLENGSDNTKLTIGDNSTYSSYMQMYHDGGNSGIGYINYAGSNKMILSGNNITFMNTSRSETMLTAVQDGAVELYHNNSKKFETTSGGATVTGTLTATTFSGSGASLTGVDATTLDSIDSGSFLRSDAADSKTSGNLTFNDTIQANFGTGNDLRIYHNGADSYIENYTGHLYLFTASDDKDIILQSDNGSGGLANYVTLDGSTGEVILGHYGTQKLATTGYGATVTGGLQVSGIVTATSFAGDGSALTGISAGSPEFYTGITSSRQIAPLSFESAVFTFPSTSGRQYVIESINVANVDESVGVGTTVNIIASIEDATAAEQTYIAYNVPIVTGGLIELLKNPIVAGPSDVIRMWTTSDTYVGVNNAADVYINYTEFESTDYISKFASSTTITSTDAVTLYTSTGNPTMIEKIGFANRTDTGDFPVSIKITNGVTTSYLAKNLIIPRYSTVDILDRHKRIETGAKIEVEVGSTNTIDVIISGKKITT